MTIPVPELIAFDHRSPLLKEAASVYAAVWSRNRDDSLYFFQQHTHLPLYRAYAARLDQQTVGMAFGTRSELGQWWHNKVAEQVGAKHPALQNAWVLTELAVLPEFQGHGIGRLLLNHVLASQPLPNALLSTQQDNAGARRFYERLGWRYLHTGFAFNRGRPFYVVMYKPLIREK